MVSELKGLEILNRTRMHQEYSNTEDSSSDVAPAIPMYDEHYDYWSLLMENFLRSKEFWVGIENMIGNEDKNKKIEFQ